MRLGDSRWLEVIFATIWIVAVSVLWSAIKPSPKFGLIVGWGVRFGWPYSIAYVLLVYLISFVVIVWAGLAVYLVVFGNPNARQLVRGLWMALLTVGIIQTIMINFAGRNLSWTIRWLPYLAALVLCIELVPRMVSKSPRSQSIVKSL
jgi:hypothetical protein